MPIVVCPACGMRQYASRPHAAQALCVRCDTQLFASSSRRSDPLERIPAARAARYAEVAARSPGNAMLST